MYMQYFAHVCTDVPILCTCMSEVCVLGLKECIESAVLIKRVILPKSAVSFLLKSREKLKQKFERKTEML